MCNIALLMKLYHCRFLIVIKSKIASMSHTHIPYDLLNTSHKTYMHVYIYLYLKYRMKWSKNDYIYDICVLILSICKDSGARNFFIASCIRRGAL